MECTRRVLDLRAAIVPLISRGVPSKEARKVIRALQDKRFASVTLPDPEPRDTLTKELRSVGISYSWMEPTSSAMPPEDIEEMNSWANLWNGGRAFGGTDFNLD
jgi:hypothetical protein